MITTPVINVFRGSPTHDHGTSCIPFVDQLSGWPGRPKKLPVRSDEPIVQPLATVAERIVEVIAGAGDVPVQ
jgi:hypothetical protein